MQKMKSVVLIEGTLRVASLFVALIPQVMGLAFFAFSVERMDLITSLVAAIALVVLIFLPRFRYAWPIALTAATILAAEASWEIYEMRKAGDEIAFGTAANLAVGLLWILFLVVQRVTVGGSNSSAKES
jgi:hypothetical protein